MGWSLGFDTHWNRDIGYGVPAYCDHPGCKKVIDRGLAYVCGGDPYGGEKGCGLYFCENHREFYNKRIDNHFEFVELCYRCGHYKLPYKPKPDHPEWLHFKMTDPSWKEWRENNVAHANNAESDSFTVGQVRSYPAQINSTLGRSGEQIGGANARINMRQMPPELSGVVYRK